VTPVFTSKLDRLRETVERVAAADHGLLAAALLGCASVPVCAVGSGGSMITAEFFAACRTSLGHQLTGVVTPMAYVLEANVPLSIHTWLFSASGENQDILAAFDLALSERLALDIVTSGPNGALANAARSAEGAASFPRVHLAPVADPRDGFLATHSAVSASASLLLASDVLSGAIANDNRKDLLLADVDRIMSREFRTRLRSERLAALEACDTVILLHDPYLAAAAALIETSFWEAGICAIQRADFRNFAHGRHVWIARHPERTFVLALTCDRSQHFWSAIRDALPTSVYRANFDLGRAGRGGLFEAVLASLTVVEAAGALKGVDPGKPGVANFGRRIFEHSDLRALVAADDCAVRRKRRAELRIDPPGRETTNWSERRDEFLSNLSKAEIRALVLDYDGTVVATSERLERPRTEVLNLLCGLIDSGLLVGFASGRGGSVGEMLREQLPSRFHEKVIVGYYNGAHVALLEIDIETAPPKSDPDIAVFHTRLCSEPWIFVGGWLPKESALQVTIPFDKLVTPFQGVERIISMARKGEAGSLPLRVLRSGHSVDVFPAWAGKLRVIEKARKLIGDASAGVLTVGDSGDCQGNDYELLSGALGLSVGRVCHREGSCWNLLPAQVEGPDGLVRILRSIKPVRDGIAQIDVPFLFLT